MASGPRTTSRSVKIIDAQIHLWEGNGAPQHHQLAGRCNFTIEQALASMRAAGVDAAINCPPLWDPAANAYGLYASKRHPSRFAMYDWVDLTTQDAEANVRNALSRPGVIGLRVITASPSKASTPGATHSWMNWPDDNSLDWFWRVAEETAIPLAIYGPLLLPRVAAIAERHQRLKITLDHMGVIGVGEDGRSPVQLANVCELARFENVAVKLSAAPAYACDGYPFRSMHEIVKRLFDAFGPHRLFWGSDITRAPCSWRQCVTMFTEEMSWLSSQDIELIMGKAVAAWHDWAPSENAEAG